MNPTTPPTTTRTRRVVRVLALLFVLALLAAAAVWHGLQSLDLGHVRVIVDGEEVMRGAVFNDLSPEQHLLAVLAIAALCFALLLVVPMLVLAVAAVVLPILLLVFGLPLLLVLSLGTLLLAPLALIGLLAWWLVRALLRDNQPAPSATIAG
jgi:hypothetical protein